VGSTAPHAFGNITFFSGRVFEDPGFLSFGETVIADEMPKKNIPDSN